MLVSFVKCRSKFGIIRDVFLVNQLILILSIGCVFAGSGSYISNISELSSPLSSHHYLHPASFISSNGDECDTLVSEIMSGPVYYHTQMFYVSESGTYSITNSYQNGEIHRSIYLNCDLNIDDIRNSLLAGIMGSSQDLVMNNIQLKANNTYFLTTIPASNNNIGNYETDISGPGNIYFGSHTGNSEDEEIAISKSVESAVSDIVSNNAKSVSYSSKSAKNVVSKAFSVSQNPSSKVNFLNKTSLNNIKIMDFLLTPRLNLSPGNVKIEASMDLEYSRKYFGLINYVYEDVVPSDKTVLNKSGSINIVNLSLGYKLNEKSMIGFSISYDDANIDNKTSSSKHNSKGNMGALFYAYMLDNNISFIANSGMKSAKHSISSDNFTGEYIVKSNTIYAEASVNYSKALIEDALNLNFDASTKLVNDNYELVSDAGTGKALVYDEVLFGNLNAGFELKAFEFDDNLNTYQPYFGASIGKYFDYTKRQDGGDDELDTDLKSAIENESTHFEIFAGLDYTFEEIHTFSGRVYMNKVDGNDPYIKGLSLTYALDF